MFHFAPWRKFMQAVVYLQDFKIKFMGLDIRQVFISSKSFEKQKLPS